jgi:serine/threonine-protein kinase
MRGLDSLAPKTARRHRAQPAKNPLDRDRFLDGVKTATNAVEPALLAPRIEDGEALKTRFVRPRSRSLPPSIGRYDVVRPIGAGAMGQVLLARDRVLEREVAIKLLRDDLAIGDDVREALIVRMRHEARAAARVTHPNLVILHDMGEDDVLGLYLVFEFLDGPTLKQRIHEGRLPSRQVARIARELGAALTFAHERGVLHRDVKPENVLLTETGAKLADFGIARVPDSTLTRTEGLLGTPAYSAPETFQEAAFSPASDQFSLAATLYEALSGRRAFPGDDALTVANRIANVPPAAFAEELGYARRLDEVLARGMARSPDARFATCRDLGIAVVEAIAPRQARRGDREDASDDDAGEASHARLDGPAVRELAPAERRRTHIALGALAVLLVGGIAARAWLASNDPLAPAAASTTASTSVEPLRSVAPQRPLAPSKRPRPAPSAPARVEAGVDGTSPEPSLSPPVPSAPPPVSSAIPPTPTPAVP